MSNVIINSEQYDEFMAQKEKIKELKARNDKISNELESVKESAEDKFDLIKECDRLTNIVHEQGTDIVNLRAKNYDIKANNEELKKENEALIKERNELVVENDELKMSINDLKANNKELKAKVKEPVGLMYLMPAKDASKLCEWLNHIEERLDTYDNYIFGGKDNGSK